MGKVWYEIHEAVQPFALLDSRQYPESQVWLVKEVSMQKEGLGRKVAIHKISTVTEIVDWKDL